MIENKEISVLFDFDGVVVDTETQYSVFWHKMGVDYLGMDNLESRVKGQTLTYIYDTFFTQMHKEQEEITSALNQFEQQMSFEYIYGVDSFIADLKRNNVMMAVVTSSNKPKMEAVYRARPEIRNLFDRILTAEMFAASKPAPDCFLLGMEVFGTTPANTFVFEDSFNGLKAGMDSQATVIGLATTNTRSEIEPLCHHVLDNFEGFTYNKMLELHK